MVICLERGADLHTAQLMPLPLTISCSSKIQIGFTYQVPAHPGSPGQRAVKRVCVCSAIHNSLLYDSTNGYGQYNANVYGTIITTMAIARLCQLQLINAINE